MHIIDDLVKRTGGNIRIRSVCFRDPDQHLIEVAVDEAADPDEHG